MSRRLYSGRTAYHMAGRLAQHDGHCWVCDKAIFRQVSQVVKRKGDWIHTSCAPGAEDGAASTWLVALVAAIPLVVALVLLLTTPLTGEIGSP